MKVRIIASNCPGVMRSFVVNVLHILLYLQYFVCVSSLCHDIRIETVKAEPGNPTCASGTSERTSFVATAYPGERVQNPRLIKEDCAETSGATCEFQICDETVLEIETSDEIFFFDIFTGSRDFLAADSWIFHVYIDGVLTDPDVPCSTQIESHQNFEQVLPGCNCGGGSVSVLDANFDSINAGSFSSTRANNKVTFVLPEATEGGSEDDLFIIIAIIGGACALTIAVAILVLKRRRSRRKQSRTGSGASIFSGVPRRPLRLGRPSKTKPSLKVSANSQISYVSERSSSNPMMNTGKPGHPGYIGTPVERHWPSVVTDTSRTTLGSDMTFFFSRSVDSEKFSLDVPLQKHRDMITEDDMRLTDSIKRMSSKISNHDMAMVQKLRKRKKLKQFNLSNFASVEPAAYQSARVVTSMVCKSLKLDDEEQAGSDKFVDSQVYQEPEISLEVFLSRLIRYLDKWFFDLPGLYAVGTRSLLFCVLYFERIRSKQVDFKVTKYNVHRLFAVAMLVSAKYTEDEVITNSYWAEVCGISTPELNLMEQKFCAMAGYDFSVSEEQIEALYEAFDPNS